MPSQEVGRQTCGTRCRGQARERAGQRAGQVASDVRAKCMCMGSQYQLWKLGLAFGQAQHHRQLDRPTVHLGGRLRPPVPPLLVALEQQLALLQPSEGGGNVPRSYPVDLLAQTSPGSPFWPRFPSYAANDDDFLLKFVCCNHHLNERYQI